MLILDCTKVIPCLVESPVTQPKPTHMLARRCRYAFRGCAQERGLHSIGYASLTSTHQGLVTLPSDTNGPTGGGGSMQAVAIYAFDCLFLNGESLLPLSLRERQQKMRPGIGSVPLGISSSRQCALVPLFGGFAEGRPKKVSFSRATRRRVGPLGERLWADLGCKVQRRAARWTASRQECNFRNITSMTVAMSDGFCAHDHSRHGFVIKGHGLARAEEFPPFLRPKIC